MLLRHCCWYGRGLSMLGLGYAAGGQDDLLNVEAPQKHSYRSQLRCGYVLRVGGGVYGFVMAGANHRRLSTSAVSGRHLPVLQLPRFPRT